MDTTAANPTPNVASWFRPNPQGKIIYRPLLEFKSMYPEESASSGTECIICLNKYSTTAIAAHTPCGHFIHAPCLSNIAFSIERNAAIVATSEYRDTPWKKKADLVDVNCPECRCPLPIQQVMHTDNERDTWFQFRFFEILERIEENHSKYSSVRIFAKEPVPEKFRDGIYFEPMSSKNTVYTTVNANKPIVVLIKLHKDRKESIFMWLDAEWLMLDAYSHLEELLCGLPMRGHAVSLPTMLEIGDRQIRPTDYVSSADLATGSELNLTKEL